MKTYSRKNSSYLKKAFIASNFNEMCRLCLSELDLGLTPIFQEFSKISYQEWIRYSVDVLIEEGDGLPSNICEECLAMVEQTYLFKKKCKASDSKLREHLELLKHRQEGKLNEIINLMEDHSNLFKKGKPRNSKCDESSAVDTGGTIKTEGEVQEEQVRVEENLEQSEETNTKTPDSHEDEEGEHTKPQENVVINKVKRYILKGEKRADDQEEDLTVCEVVPLDVRNEESSGTSDMLSYTTLECSNGNEDKSSPQGKIQEICQLWDNEEGGVVKKKNDGVMLLDVSWEDGSKKNEKSQNLGFLEVNVEQNGVVQLHRVYTNKNQLGRVKRKTMNDTCFVCGKVFTTVSQLKGHMSKFHREVADSAFCKTCGKTFVCLNNLKRHMGIHLGYKPHKCKICGRTFSQGSILKRHIFTHETLKPFNCQFCGKGYTQKTNLLAHFKNHGFRMVSESFSCQHCSKSFVHQSGLSRHLRLHKGIRFHCKLCKKSFVDSSALARHVKVIHQGET